MQRRTFKRPTHSSDDFVEQENSFDDLMASLLVLVTHHSQTQCQASVAPILDRLNQLCCHSEIELYPSQQTVLAKMCKLWQIKNFELNTSNFEH